MDAHYIASACGQCVRMRLAVVERHGIRQVRVRAQALKCQQPFFAWAGLAGQVDAYRDEAGLQLIRPIAADARTYYMLA